MSPAPSLPEAPLANGETALSGWPADWEKKPASVRGWLLVTDRRIAFFASAGVLSGRRLRAPPGWESPLRAVRSVSVTRFSMQIGYGEYIPIPGVIVDGQSFRLNREASAPAVVAAIEQARGGGALVSGTGAGLPERG